jgi:aspartate/methionine/tyrosine aminotransferase
MKTYADRTHYFKDSIFGVISKLSLEHQAVNLGQGFPDFDGANFLQNYVTQKMQQGFNQYAPFPGSVNLRNSVSSYYKRFYNLNYSADSEITITAGATEAIFATIMALVNPGDEVIVFEPFYDSYISSIRMAGGIPVPVTLHAPEFMFDPNELKKALSAKTKLIIFNNPLNPVGKVFNQTETKILKEILENHDCYIMSDEVYEFLTFDGIKHSPLAQFESLKDRIITVSSAGKTFGYTGWKIGWTCANHEISRLIRLVHQYVVFSVATPIQEAIAMGLNELETYLPNFVKTYQEKRDLLYIGFRNLGFDFKKPEGTYFAMVPIHQKTKMNDVDFAQYLIRERKVASIPPSAFYLNSNDGSKYLRFCFAKKDETIKLALERLNGM